MPASGLLAQAPAPPVESDRGTIRKLAAEGAYLLRCEDPLRALDVFRTALARDSADADVLVGAGRCHLLLGDPGIALAYARAVLADEPTHDRAIGLEVRALMRARRFREAVDRSTRAVSRRDPGVETLAAHASALFRTQRNDDAARFYHRVLALDPLYAEAHLRLGSGLTAPRVSEIGTDLEQGTVAARAGRLEEAIRCFRRALDRDPGNPVAHRLLGEVLFRRVAEESMATRAAEFRWLQSTLPKPQLGKVPVDQFMPALGSLSTRRRRVAERSLALFSSRISRLVTMGGRHDLITELERTTDAPARANLRGRRTFDGRVWDDVRGIGGLRAATGIESLDEAIGHGFDTLSHEVAHQAHLYAFPHRDRIKIRHLYDKALAENRCLDFYAASNDAEYFGQGVEAFASLGKRPVYEVTHGHTRFELMRMDPALHDLIAKSVDYDPLSLALRTSAQRTEVLRAAIAVALRSGRHADAVTAAGLLPEGGDRASLMANAQRAVRLARSY